MAKVPKRYAQAKATCRRAGGIRRARAARVAAAPAGRLPDARRRRRHAVRRQGARPEEARRQLLPEVRATSRASRLMIAQVGERRDHGHALRRRGAAAREQPDQGARAALQRPLPRRQELPVRLPHRRRISAAALPPRQARPAATATSARSRAPARCATACSLLQKVFQLRTCENTVFANRSRPCMLHQIQRCSAPCVGLIAEADYARRRAAARRCSCRARPTRCSTELKAQMEAAAAALEFERAARAARQDPAAAAAAVAAVRRERDRPATSTSSRRPSRAAWSRVNVVMIRGGRHVGDRSVLSAARRRRVCRRRWCRRSSRSTTSSGRCRRRSSRPTPGDGGALAEVLSAQSARQVEIVANPGGERRVWLTMAAQNAQLAIARSWRRRRRRKSASPRCRRRSACRRRRSASSASTCRTRWARRAVASCVIFDRLAMQTSRVPPLQRDAAARRRRLRGDARGADAALRAHRRRRIPGAGPAGDRRRQGAGRRRRRRCSPSTACTTRR